MTDAEREKEIRERGLAPDQLEAKQRELEFALQQSIENERQLADRLAATNTAAPFARWEANRAGLSGRMIRGYRHWRYKR